MGLGTSPRRHSVCFRIDRPVTVLCRSFDHLLCSKGDEPSAQGRADEFRKEAVRIALTSGLSRRQVADDLGVGFSTLNKWVSAHRGTDVVSAEDRDLARENERLRREVRILKEERDILGRELINGIPTGARF